MNAFNSVSSWSLRASAVVLVAIGLLLLPAAHRALFADEPEPPGVASSDRPPAAAPVAPPPPAPVDASADWEARLVDGGTMKLAVRDIHVELITPYGKLRVPFTDIRRIEFAYRLSDELTQRISALIADLGHEDYNKREAAMTALASLGDKAGAALVKAAEHPDAEVSRRAKVLMEKLAENGSPEKILLSKFDILQTAESTIAGRVDASALAVRTAQFGNLTLKLADVRELTRADAVVDVEPVDVIADPGSLSNFQGQTGKTLAIRVTGGALNTGTIWGADRYTLDSTLAVAAVHAGVLKTGETKVLHVTIEAFTGPFSSSTRNGITSHPYSNYPGAYRFRR